MKKQYRENGDVAFPCNGNIKQSESEKAISALKRELRDIIVNSAHVDHVIPLHRDQSF